MRYSPNGQHIVMERGQHPSDGPRRLEVCEAATGAVVATFPAGFNPRWLNNGIIFAESPSGRRTQEVVADWLVQYEPSNRGQLDARGGYYAVSDLREAWLAEYGGALSDIANAREPRLGPALALAVRHPATGHLRYTTGNGKDIDLGPCEDSRWSSETLVWWLGGRVWGRIVPTDATVELTVPGRSCAKPVPLWTGSRLFVGLVLDDGELWVAEWGDLVARNGLGWEVGRSDGSGFDWDMRERDPGWLRISYFDPLGQPVAVDVSVTAPRESMLRQPEPEPIPDQPFVVDPTGVVEDVAAWIFSPDQGPDVHLSPDGRIRMFVKSDERSGDGPDPEISEHWDLDDRYIGHLEDSSTGRRILDGKEVIAEDIVRLFPNDHARVWAGLKLNRNTFKDGARLWMPRRCVSGTRIRYVTDITWTVPPRETPHTRVWRSIPVEIRVDVGYGVIHGKEVRVRAAYVPDGNAEVNYYSEPKGFNAWVAGPFATFDAEWMNERAGRNDDALRVRAGRGRDRGTSARVTLLGAARATIPG